jgi:hypothetical protein
MNTKIKTYIGLLLILICSSCDKDFFDQVPDDRLQIEDIFKRRTTTEQYLANIYNRIRTQMDWRFDNSFESLSDDIDVTYNDMAPFQLNIGNWDRNTSAFNRWGHYYQGIRSATFFIQNVDLNPEVPDAEKTKWKAEARFLRAYFYANLMMQYGPVILMPEELLAPDATIEEISLPRNTYDECVEYVVSEINTAIPDLPMTPVNTREWGRINRGMALAFKSRVLLYAASPLFNGNTDYADFKNLDGTVLVNQQYDANKWKLAADAAKDMIDFGQYSLYMERDAGGAIMPYESLKNVHLTDWNSEVIMARVSDNFGPDKMGSPRNVGGWSAFGPTQQLVDAFFMSNGRPITDPASGYSETGTTAQDTRYYAPGTSNMYVGREPRFYVAITFNLSKWINNDRGSNNQPVTIQMYSGGNSGLYNGRNYSRTGYGARKLVHPSTTLEPDRIQGRLEVQLRLAEVYLNYVESLNEYDPEHPDIVKYLNMIRERAGIPQYGSEDGMVPVPGGKDAMRQAIQQERRVELCFENLRYFDTHRWKIAAQTDGGDFYGMNIEATTSAGFHQRTVFETRQWKDKQYLWNIVQDELNKNRNLVENPGW